MKKIAIALYGSPGSGKGTQANLLAGKYNLIHFDTGRFLESVVHDPLRQKDPIIARERKFFDTGMLMTPSFVTREVRSALSRVARAGWGVVLSGSPRTMYEAERLIPALEKLYGKQAIHVFVLETPAKDAIKRNASRVLCSVCKAPLLTAYYPSKKPKYCPICAGPFYKRTLDTPGVMQVRLREYEERTVPIFGYLTKRGYRVTKLDARPAPHKVFSAITKKIEG